MKGMDMKNRIDLELRGKDKATIRELNLDSCRGQQIDGLNDEFKSLEILSLINVGLTTLKGFPKLPALKKLELSDNRISSSLENLNGCENISYLNLSGNKIKELDQLAPLSKLENLRNLDLFNCEVTQIDDYRENVFKLLPNLKFLDGFDQNEQEDELSSNEGDNDSEDDSEEDEEDLEDAEQDEHGNVIKRNGRAKRGINEAPDDLDSEDDDDEDDDEDYEDDDDDEDGEDGEDGQEDDDEEDADEQEEFVASKKKKLDHNAQ